MQWSKCRQASAFTLLELVVVLAILAVVTTLAVRSLDRVEDERRYEAGQRGLEEIAAAIVGTPEDRAADGSPTRHGFLADMGRLPRTKLVDPDGTGGQPAVLTLQELWDPVGAAYAIRPAIEENILPQPVGPNIADDQVLVAGGWRGPYLRLPLGSAALVDAWGNPMTAPSDASPPNPDSTGHARLRDEAGAALAAENLPVHRVRHLGSDGSVGTVPGEPYSADSEVGFGFQAELSGTVEVVEEKDGEIVASDPNPADSIVVRVFGPHPDNAERILVVSSAPVPFAANPVVWSIPQASGATAGARVVRAYRISAGGVARCGAVKYATLRPGPNLLNLTIDRPPSTP